jgi:hypothetical protein
MVSRWYITSAALRAVSTMHRWCIKGAEGTPQPSSRPKPSLVQQPRLGSWFLESIAFRELCTITRASASPRSIYTYIYIYIYICIAVQLRVRVRSGSDLDLNKTNKGVKIYVSWRRSLAWLIAYRVSSGDAGGESECSSKGGGKA